VPKGLPGGSPASLVTGYLRIVHAQRRLTTATVALVGLPSQQVIWGLWGLSGRGVGAAWCSSTFPCCRTRQAHTLSRVFGILGVAVAAAAATETERSRNTGGSQSLRHRLSRKQRREVPHDGVAGASL
jgi:hypothetical protein